MVKSELKRLHSSQNLTGSCLREFTTRYSSISGSGKAIRFIEVPDVCLTVRLILQKRMKAHNLHSLLEAALSDR